MSHLQSVANVQVNHYTGDLPAMRTQVLCVPVCVGGGVLCLTEWTRLVSYITPPPPQAVNLYIIVLGYNPGIIQTTQASDDTAVYTCIYIYRPIQYPFI